MSGNGHDLGGPGNVNGTPTFNPTGMNGRPGIDMTNGQSLNSASNFGLTGTQNMTVFEVVTYTSSPQSNSFTFGGQGQHASIQMDIEGNYVGVATGFGQDVRSNATSAVTNSFSQMLVSFSYAGGPLNSATTSLKVNGTQYINLAATDGNTLSLNDGRAFVGNSSDASAPGFSGDLAEVIVYNGVLSATDENTIGYYLAQKYGFNTSYAPNGSSWTGANSTVWANLGNWNGSVPGATSGTASTDSAVFDTYNPTNPAPVVDAGRNLQNIVFNNNAGNLTGSVTLGTTTGQALLLTSGGEVISTATLANPQTINAPLVIEGVGGTFRFSSNGSAGAATLNFGGAITAGASSGATTLTLTGTNTGANTISGAIGDGGLGATLALAVTSGSWTLSGPSTYSGATTITGGTLVLGAGGSLGNTVITAASGTTFAARPGSGTVSAGSASAGSAGATLSLASGSTFSMVDGAVGTFNLQQQASFGASNTALSLSGATLNFDLSSSGADQLAVNVGKATVSGANAIGLNAVGSSLTNGGNYPLISVPAGGLSTGGSFQFKNGSQAAYFPTGGNLYQLSLHNSSTAETVSVAATGVTSPPVTASLYAWYNAAVGVTVNGSNVIQTLADLSGNGHDMQYNNGSPTLNPTGFHGQPAIQLTTTNGSGDALRTVNTFGLSGSPSMTVFAVFTDTSPASMETHAFIFGTQAPEASMMLGKVSSRAAMITGFGDNDTSTYNVTTNGFSNIIESFRYTGGSALNAATTSLKVNGTEYFAGGLGSGPSGTLNISSSSYGWIGYSPGGLGTSATGLTGDIAEILVYNGVLTNAQENSVGYYLAQQFGLTTAYTPSGSFWTGGASTSNWSDTGNWTGSVPPARDLEARAIRIPPRSIRPSRSLR